MTAANIVDVSEWQPTSIDWTNLKANGIKAVVVRIGHGTTRDANAADHISNATKAGLIVQVYHYYEGVDGELQWSVNNAKSLNVQPNVYYFLDMEGTIAGSWSSIFELFRKTWSGYGWKTGLYCSLSNYAKFDNATLVKQGVYRWIAAWGSTQPSNADMWQYDSKTGLGYTSALDKDVDIAGKLIVAPNADTITNTDPNGNYELKTGAFVGFDYSTTSLRGGKMLVASPDGKNKIPKLAPTGAFLFNNADGDNMWTLIKPKIQMPKLTWSAITGKPDLVLKTDLTWSNISGKPDVATKSDVSSVSTVANTAKSTADSALSKANANATTLATKIGKSDLTWANISGKPSIPNADDTTTISSGDLNGYTTTGKYYMPNELSNYTNHPTGTDIGGFVMKVDSYHNGDMIIQTIYQINSGDVWIRQHWANSWKAWRQVTFWPKGG